MAELAENMPKRVKSLTETTQTVSPVPCACTSALDMHAHLTPAGLFVAVLGDTSTPLLYLWRMGTCFYQIRCRCGNGWQKSLRPSTACSRVRFPSSDPPRSALLPVVLAALL
jgi:hypothetical protein